MTTALSDQGIQFAGGNVVDVRTSYPTTGTYTAGDIVLESSTAARVSGWKRQTTGSNNVLNTDWIYFTSLNLSTSVATTSGTAVDYTNIPSWVKRITLTFKGVSTTGTSNTLVQIGSGSVQTTGYSGSHGDCSTSGGVTVNTRTTGVGIGGGHDASVTLEGTITFTTQGSNNWIASGVIARSNSGVLGWTASSVALSGALDRLRLTTIGGTDTFDAGSVNIMYEG